MSAIHTTSGIEVWKDIKGFEGYYQVSNQGRIKSLLRVINGLNRWGSVSNRTIKERIMSLGDASGYMLVFLCKGGKYTKFIVSVLVLEHFGSKRPNSKMECCHNDGNYRNNRIDNLRWDTHKGNHQDRISHGTNNRGTKNGSAKINEDKVKEIRNLYATGKYLMKDIGKMYGLHAGTVRTIIRKVIWKHVD